MRERHGGGLIARSGLQTRLSHTQYGVCVLRKLIPEWIEQLSVSGGSGGAVPQCADRS